MKTKILFKTVKMITVCLFACFTLVVLSCSNGDDSPEEELSGCDGLDELIAAYSDATENFFNNQTEDNCETLRARALEVIEKAETCPGFIDEYGAAEEAAQEWIELDCSEFSG